MALPSHDVSTGTLPPGRYRATLQEIEQAYVLDPAFAKSQTRRRNWEGFAEYRSAWAVAEETLGLPASLVQGYWIAGSFISDTLDPDDIDVTVLLDGDLLDSCANRKGMGQVKKLYANRAKIKAVTNVEPFILKVRWEESTLIPKRLPRETQLSLATRGGLDNFWQRVRPPGPKDAPVARQTALAERGYLEVAV